jgi:hypothetical protein
MADRVVPENNDSQTLRFFAIGPFVGIILDLEFSETGNHVRP